MPGAHKHVIEDANKNCTTLLAFLKLVRSVASSVWCSVSDTASAAEVSRQRHPDDWSYCWYRFWAVCTFSGVELQSSRHTFWAACRFSIDTCVRVFLTYFPVNAAAHDWWGRFYTHSEVLSYINPNIQRLLFTKTHKYKSRLLSANTGHTFICMPLF